jgi:hypothetical protein
MSNPPPPPNEPPGGHGGPPRRRLPGGPWPWTIGAALLLIAAATVLVVVLRGGEEEAKAQTVRFQQATDVGPDPFLEKPAERKGRKKVKITPSSPEVGAGPFGGTGSDLVCDRDLLIKSLKARPDRLAEWARVLGVEPTIKAVGTYITKLHPVTLTRDTRVTNHSFVNGRAVGYQAILAAGTAVLVDDHGNPVVRCRCGNPLLKPVFIPTAVCTGCPPAYEPPPPCPYTEEVTYRRRWYPAKYYSNGEYDEIFVRRFRSPCYSAYPDPPRVRITDIYDPRLKPKPKPKRTPTPRPTPEAAPEQPPVEAPETAPETQQQTNPAASFSPASGPVCRSYTLSVSGFLPNRTLSISLARPDGVVESYSMTTRADGSGFYTFGAGPQCADDVQGIYTATVSDPQTGDSAQASVGVSGGGDDDGELQCNPPRSQLESEQCAEAGMP